MRLSDIKIHRKLFLLVLILVCGTLITASLALSFNKSDILEGRKARIQSVVQAGLSQIQALSAHLDKGSISQQQYDHQLQELINATRFSGSEYLYLFNLDGFNIAHPLMPELRGTNRMDMQDEDGIYITREMLKGIKANGATFWQFSWPKPEGGPAVPKLGYAEQVPGTELVLGSGIYLDDLAAIFQARVYSYLGITLVVLFAALIATYYIARNIAKPVGRLAHQMNTLAQGELDVELIDTTRRDEVGDIACAVQVFRDHLLENHRLRQIQEQVVFLETYDPVTRLHNRQALGEAINKEITRHDRDHKRLAVVVIRLDLLHEITIEKGSEKRDEVLITLAARIHDQLHADDILARLSEDTFGLLLPNVENRDSLESDCRQLLETIAQPIPLESHHIQLSGRLGISVFPDDGGYDFQLIGRAESTASLAKRQERDLMFYDPRALNETDHSIELWQEMQKALEQDHFYLVFQPLFDLKDNTLISAEVLIRWEHPEKGFISPAQFIPLAEQSGLISRLDAWVLEAVAKQISCWQRRQLTPPRIAVNLSGISFLRPDFIDTLTGIYSKYNVSLDHLELELTEGVLIDDLDRISDQLNSIRATGVSISIDDFGTGYSSLSRIKNLAIDNVKIDRSFIDDLDHCTQDLKIVEAIILMAQGLNLSVIAEGVETQEQLNILRQQGCNTVQGFFLSRPLKVDAFEELLEQDLVIEVD